MDDLIDPVARSLLGLSFADPSLSEHQPGPSQGKGNPYELLEDSIFDTSTDQIANGREGKSPSTETSSTTTASQAKDTSLTNPKLENEEFRLLKFHTGQTDSKLSCFTSCETLNAPPAYIALSYSWGFVDVSHSIEVDGQEVLVSAAVYSALQSLRKQFVFEVCDGNVWIDAVSINQKDPEEKTQQVQMMSMIYQKATFVVGWLGEMTAANRRGFDVIKRVNKLIGITEVYDENLHNRIERPAISSTFTQAERLGVPCIGHPSWEDVATIFDKGWFGRVWVIQELLYAQTFMFLCGDALFEDDVLHFAATMSRVPYLMQAVREARGSGPGYTLASSLATWREERSKGARTNLQTCLMRTISAAATDPRDKVFAMISLCNDVGPEIIDYRRSPRQVLLAYALHQFKTAMPNVEALLSLPQVFTRVEGVPSWVTSWFGSEPAGCPGLSLFKFSALKQNLTMPPILPMGIAIAGPRLALAIHTQKLDTIVAILDPHVSTSSVPSTSNLQRDIFDPDYYAWFVAFWTREHQRLELHRTLSDLTEGLGTYPTTSPIEEIYWRSKSFDDTHHLPSAEIHRRRALIHDGTLQTDVTNILFTAARLNELRAQGHDTWTPESMRYGLQYERLVRDYQLRAAELGEEGVHGGVPVARDYAITEKGYVAWLPPGCEVGDELHLVDGARVPFVLRRLDGDGDVEDGGSEVGNGEDGGDGYSGYRALDARGGGRQLAGPPVRLVGDAYVHGLMTGAEIYESGLLDEKTMVAIY